MSANPQRNEVDPAILKEVSTLAEANLSNAYVRDLYWTKRLWSPAVVSRNVNNIALGGWRNRIPWLVRHSITKQSNRLSQCPCTVGTRKQKCRCGLERGSGWNHLLDHPRQWIRAAQTSIYTCETYDNKNGVLKPEQDALLKAWSKPEGMGIFFHPTSESHHFVDRCMMIAFVAANYADEYASREPTATRFA